MKKCNAELMKDLKELQYEIKKLIDAEVEESVVTYTSKEKKIENGYNYQSTRSKLSNMQKEERKIKSLLAKSNATTKVDGFNMTLAEGLVYLAELNTNKTHLEKLCARQAITRVEPQNYGSNLVQYRETRYKLEDAKSDLKKVKKEIAKLQMAIDRTNLTNMIEC